MGTYNQNWDEISRNIQSLVDEAIQSKDYEKLSQSIRNTVSKAVDMGAGTVKKYAATAGAAQQGNTSAAGTAKVGTVESRNLPALYGSTNKQTIYGILKIVGGAFLTLNSFGEAMVAILSKFLFGDTIGLTAILAILTFCGGAYLLYRGVRTLGMVNRFSVYKRIIGRKTFCALEKLARGVGKNTAFVRDELTKMIEKGFFTEGHLDNEGNNLIISDETFHRFEQSRLALEQQKKEAAAAAPTPAPAPQKTTQDDSKVQDVLTRGNNFIQQIRKCNDDIPGEEISNKIYQIETLVQRIFQRAQAHPEIIPDLQKMMDYYLPMTVKLLNAYAEMDAQPIQGTTIQASKREIEETIDTLILAFEKLLDSVFQDTALDVSSDISVLNTLLAQDGLMEDDLTKLKKQKQPDEKGESVCSQN